MIWNAHGRDWAPPVALEVLVHAGALGWGVEFALIGD